MNKEKIVPSESKMFEDFSVLSAEELADLIVTYGITASTGVRLASPSETVKRPEEGWVAIFESQLKSGLRFPLFKLLIDIINFYEVSISQIFPLGLTRIVAFELACREAKVASSVTLFRCFYHLKKNLEGYYFCTRTKGREFACRFRVTDPRWLK